MKKVFALLLAVVLLTTITATCFAAHTHSWKTVGWTYSGSSNYYHTVSGCHNCGSRFYVLSGLDLFLSV